MESSDIDDTIKGEDHFNISKFKMRIKNLDNKRNVNFSIENQNIHKFGGAYNINEVANRVCNKDLEVEPLIKYFKDKYE